MNCEEFKRAINDHIDARQAIAKDGLPADIRSHAHGCLSCTLYLESVSKVDEVLRNARSAGIPAELYDKLMDIGSAHRTGSALASLEPLVIYVLRILLPAVVVWTGALFLPAFPHVIVEITLMIFAMVLVFEKLGRRILTDRV